MDDTLRLIQYLYGEDVDDPDFGRRVAEDEDLQRECEQLQQTKDALDRRSTPSPDPEVVDRVVSRAADAANGTAGSTIQAEPASDRAARAPTRSWRRRLQGATTAVLVLLAVAVGWWQFGGDETGSATATTQQSGESVTVGSGQTQEDDIPEWDDREEVVQLHRRIEMVRSRSRSDTWGTELQTVDQTRP